MHTLDSLIELLQQQRDGGLPGDTVVMVVAQDNNGRPGYAKRVTGTHQVSVAKADFDKGWETCRVVANRGVQALLVS